MTHIQVMYQGNSKVFFPATAIIGGVGGAAGHTFCSMSHNVIIWTFTYKRLGHQLTWNTMYLCCETEREITDTLLSKFVYWQRQKMIYVFTTPVITGEEELIIRFKDETFPPLVTIVLPNVSRLRFVQYNVNIYDKPPFKSFHRWALLRCSRPIYLQYT